MGADKVSQADRLQGCGISYCYGDEMTTWCENVFQMLKSRLDKDGACFDGTCNPTAPSHWVYQFIQSDADVFAAKFTIDDNPFLSPDFVSALKNEYFGSVYYDRFILGLWRAAEGSVYSAFANSPDNFIIDSLPDDISFCTAGLDFGGNGSAHALNLTGFTKNLREVITIDEWFCKDDITPEILENLVCDFLSRACAKFKLTDLYCDSAEQVLIRGIKHAVQKRNIPVAVHNARKGDILGRIRFYTMLFGARKYRIMRSCKHTIDAFLNAVWDEKSECRLDNGSTNIDSLDAQEYSTENMMNYIIDMR